MSEIIVLGVLALIVIGPKELPELARSIGRFLNELKRTTNVLQDELKEQVRLDRLDLRGDEAVTPPSIDPATTGHHIAAPPADPQQMELTDQSSAEEKKEEHKPS
ncbi:Sec-independent protein translocase subunit TatA/TatB [Bdellovibrio reynosensis]|uniref:Twin-arginine translocase TatA/TatE family subunit n=1 Tax=Bdellovibrio reynosensis TaxID=2835041 RepID=A0ABY4C9U4_9BACT|nr:twin-arginine translocase TatA/TatE family subunit [Bdellovibrio reynosensis]UOF00446.1 twin-arginine translocase TatA/TatE family subunit [Bdellovibrio reynosensis]